MAPITLTDDLRISAMNALDTPWQLIAELPCSEEAAQTVQKARHALQRILRGADDRMVVIIGPCSIHDPASALEYAQRLQPLRDSLGDALEIVMRVYFEKPRTTVGWKGIINDPDLDGSFNINKGLRIARRLLHTINALGLPAGCEYLDVTTPQFIADLVAWGAIGARTTESQLHREMSSGLSCPIGFKNGTDGNVRIAVDAITAAASSHRFMAVAKDGRAAIAATTGNPDCHIILRGGKAPNYDQASVDAACDTLGQAGLAQLVMIDASHANSHKKPENQPQVIADIARRIAAGEKRIFGVMIESHLVAGSQRLIPGQPLTYGQSITDGCIGWDDTVKVLEQLAQAVRARLQY